MSKAWSVFRTAWGLALLVLAFSRSIVSICDSYAEVACAGDPSDDWINPHLLGPSLPPAGTIFHFVFVCVGDNSTPPGRIFSKTFCFALYNSDDAIFW